MTMRTTYFAGALIEQLSASVLAGLETDGIFLDARAGLCSKLYGWQIDLAGVALLHESHYLPTMPTAQFIHSLKSAALAKTPEEARRHCPFIVTEDAGGKFVITTDNIHYRVFFFTKRTVFLFDPLYGNKGWSRARSSDAAESLKALEAVANKFQLTVRVRSNVMYACK